MNHFCFFVEKLFVEEVKKDLNKDQFLLLFYRGHRMTQLCIVYMQKNK